MSPATDGLTDGILIFSNLFIGNSLFGNSINIGALVGSLIGFLLVIIGLAVFYIRSRRNQKAGKMYPSDDLFENMEHMSLSYTVDEIPQPDKSTSLSIDLVSDSTSLFNDHSIIQSSDSWLDDHEKSGTEEPRRPEIAQSII